MTSVEDEAIRAAHGRVVAALQEDCNLDPVGALATVATLTGQMAAALEHAAGEGRGEIDRAVAQFISTGRQATRKRIAAAELAARDAEK